VGKRHTQFIWIIIARVGFVQPEGLRILHGDGQNRDEMKKNRLPKTRKA
jgi:hypothetical protein